MYSGVWNGKFLLRSIYKCIGNDIVLVMNSSNKHDQRFMFYIDLQFHI